MESPYRELAAKLASDSALSQSCACLKLGQMGADAESLIPQVIQTVERLESEPLPFDRVTTYVAMFGAMALRQFLQASWVTDLSPSPQADAAWSALVRLAESRNVVIAHSALSELGWLGRREALPILRRVMCAASSNTAISLRARAFQALLRIASEEATSQDYLSARDEYAAACLKWAADYRNRGLTDDT